MALYDSQYSLDKRQSPFNSSLKGLRSLGGGPSMYPNIESGFFNSPEYQGLPTIGTSDVVQKKYFGTGSGSIDSDSAYEAYLNRTGQTDRIIPGYAPGMDPSEQENRLRMLPGTGIQERPPSPLSYEEQVAAQQQKRLDGDMGRYIGIGEGPIMPGPVDYDEPETEFKSTLMPPQQTINTSAGPMLPPTPMPNPPVSLPRPTTMPMPGDVGYVPYGSRNNQLVPPGYEKPSFVQGLAGGGPVGNLSFVELLKQIMEN